MQRILGTAIFLICSAGCFGTGLAFKNGMISWLALVAYVAIFTCAGVWNERMNSRDQ